MNNNYKTKETVQGKKKCDSFLLKMCKLLLRLISCINPNISVFISKLLNDQSEPIIKGQ